MESIDLVSLRYSIQQKSEKKQRSAENSGSNKIRHDGLSQDFNNASTVQPLILKKTNQGIDGLSVALLSELVSWKPNRFYVTVEQLVNFNNLQV